MKAHLTMLLCLALLGGCATSQMAPRAAAPVPADRLLASGGAGDASIAIVRDSGFLGSGCYLMVYVNKAPVARLDGAEKISLQVPSGDLLLAVGGDPQGRSICGMRPDHKVQREFTIKSGELKHFRIAVGSGGMDVLRSDF